MKIKITEPGRVIEIDFGPNVPEQPARAPYDPFGSRVNYENMGDLMSEDEEGHDPSFATNPMPARTNPPAPPLPTHVGAPVPLTYPPQPPPPPAPAQVMGAVRDHE